MSCLSLSNRGRNGKWSKQKISVTSARAHASNQNKSPSTQLHSGYSTSSSKDMWLYWWAPYNSTQDQTERWCLKYIPTEVSNEYINFRYGKTHLEGWNSLGNAVFIAPLQGIYNISLDKNGSDSKESMNFIDEY
ncbi:hypothetical protein VNO78_17837 [Psophocarpus tetragonolobus]|uniref:Uncharacterized protein n=1 Tax=Psophocarpus tetragonolobus TaxID=3891 RepID=A0AAN9SI97_PSOTE